MAARIAADRRRSRALARAVAITPVADIARQVGLTRTPCKRRIEKLLKSGEIARYTIERGSAPQETAKYAYLSVALHPNNRESMRTFETVIATMSEVLVCDAVAGQDADYLILLRSWLMFSTPTSVTSEVG